MATTLSRRALVTSALAASGSSVLPSLTASSLAEAAEPVARWAAVPPAGFVRTSMPGKIVKVSKANTLQPNGAYPKPEAARLMLERAMMELTGETDLGAAFGKFVHKDDIVAIKPNGIAGKKTRKMAANKELVLEIVRGVMAAGVPAENITIFEQFKDFMWATRIASDRAVTPDADVPTGVKLAVHLNKDAVMDNIWVGGIPTKYVRPFTEATAVINVSQIKDHSLCGYTGTLKNITHGCNINPHAFHQHHASPQIAHLYAQEVIRSRVVLHITDAFQVIYDKGPIDVDAKRRVPHEAIYACTDPVAMDVIGWGVVEKLRLEAGLATLKADGREPTYLATASELGLGIYDRNAIRLREVNL